MNCIDNLPKCKAVCCKSVILPLTLQKAEKGEKIFWKCNLTQDLILYYKLHGFKYAHGILSVILDDFTLLNGKIMIRNKCDWLTDDLRCKAHGTPQKPFACRDFNETTVDSGKYYVHPECIYHAFKEERENI